jgi:hypothetical protein
MKTLFLFLFCLSILSRCSNYQKIGNSTYKVKTSRSNIGEFDALIMHYRQYSIKRNKMFPSLIKAQKLNSENKNDSIFAYGTLKALNLNRQNKIITTE